jgi:predicted alpha/beta superfamily hydrolase
LQRIIDEERKLYIYKNGTGGPIIYWGMFPGKEEQAEQLALKILESKPEAAFTLAAYEVANWNRDFSPWKNDSGKETFAGGGPVIASWLLEQVLPFVRKTSPNFNGEFLAGYSLAGLFSLWMFYETKIFCGAISCSGSLWFEGWKAYAEQAKAPENSYVYLSLGGKEEKTADPIMASVGDMTRWQSEQLKQDTNIIHHKLEWNSGGHFADPIKCLTKGILWLLETTKP